MRLLLLVAVFSFPLLQMRGETTWIGGVGEFGDPANWSGGVVPDGNDAILINNGGTVQSSGMNSVLGVTLGGSSTLEVLPGVGSQFLVSDEFYVGATGVGALSIASQALVATGDFYVGFGQGSTGNVTMSGGTLSPFATYIGYEGNANFSLQNGSTLESTVGYVGYLPGSHGVIHLSDSTWAAEEQELPVNILVGVQGSGEIHSTNSHISALQLLIGDSAGAQGLVSVSGGNVTIEQDIRVGNVGGGNLTLTNGATVSSDGIAIGAQAGSSGSVSVTNSTLTSSANIFVGLSGNGSLETDGAQINAEELFLGRNTGSSGSAEISGGSMTLVHELHVGVQGDATFTLLGGGTLQTDKGNMGFDNGTTGVVNIEDGHWNSTQALFVGVSGNGTLNAGTSGVITSESGYIAQNTDGVGTVNMTGGSWTMSNTLAVGVNGVGEFSVTDGGEVSSAWSQIGLNTGSRGVATVNNASWTTTQTLTIGSGGDGEFYVSNNATVTARAIELAATANVTALFNVADSTLNAENIIAASGEASFEFSEVRLNLLGGSEVVDTLLIDGFASGAAVVGTGGLIIDTQGGNAQIASALSGVGSLTKTGQGRLRLNTANSLSGGVIIEEGLLEIANNASLGTAGTRVGTAELRVLSNVTLSDAEPGSPPALTIAGSQTATFSATSGNTFTLALQEFIFEDGAGMVAGSVGHAGTVVFDPEALTIPSVVAQIGVDAGTLVAGSGRLAQLTAIAGETTVAAGATLDFQDNLSGGGINVLLGAGVVNTGVLSETSLVVNSGDFAGNISGNGALVKETEGTLILSGQNAFIGGTTINAGTLLVNGDLSFGLGSATVNSGATLGGNGILGAIYLNGGTLAPGSSAGTLTAQNLEWESGVLSFDLGPDQAGSDLLVTGGLVGLGSSYAFTFVNEGWIPGETYTLINFVNSSIEIGDFYFTNGGGFDGVFGYNGNNLEFTITTVPEPSAFVLLTALATIAFFIRIGRRGTA